MRRSTLWLLLVFVVLAVLSAALRPGSRSQKNIADRETAREELHDIHSTVLLYLRGRQGGDLLTVDMLVGSEHAELSRVPARDPWGNAYEIRPGRGAWAFEVISGGPDGILDTDDDLSSITSR